MTAPSSMSLSAATSTQTSSSPDIVRPASSYCRETISAPGLSKARATLLPTDDRGLVSAVTATAPELPHPIVVPPAGAPKGNDAMLRRLRLDAPRDLLEHLQGGIVGYAI